MGVKEKFFEKHDWVAFWTATILSFIGYVLTLAPTVTLEDSGELAVAGDWLGVPHPPGYPIWTMCAWLFARVFSFVKYLGQPNPAWSIALLSAVFGALAAGITALLICRSGKDLLHKSDLLKGHESSSTENIICVIGGVVASFAFAFSPVMWSQSVIVEVYSLNAFFLVLIFLFTYMWLNKPSDKLLYITAFVFGLGLTNYQVLLLAVVPLIIVMFMKDQKLTRDFILLLIPYAIVMALFKLGSVEPSELQQHSRAFQQLYPFFEKFTFNHPSDPIFTVYIVLDFLAMAIAFFVLPRGKTVAITMLLAQLGVAFYLYMPIVSDLLNPPMNWGYPRTWEGFQHALSRGQYERIKPAPIFTLHYMSQVGDYLKDLRIQFTLPVVLLGFLPFAAWEVKLFGLKFKALYASIAVFIISFAVVVVEELLFGNEIALSWLYKPLIALMLLMSGIGFCMIVVNQVKEMFDKMIGKVETHISEKIIIGIGFFAVVGLVGTYFIKITQNLFTALALLGEQLPAGVPAPGLQVAGLVALLLLPVILFIGISFFMKNEKFELKTDFAGTSCKWFIAVFVGFLVMSILLISLANPKGDIQDAFIQKVKFISSHALFTFWIGYGLIFGLAFSKMIFKKKVPILYVCSLIGALLMMVIPIKENYTNKELIRVYGGAEQNGHNFGWQFGNYQLRGADAISEELDEEDEPLPNPEYPPAMTTNAVFYGGTDPGRFVPTYMIYSADVRPDVFLITQNALADNTFMSITRDLYGDMIWIPSKNDSAYAFQVYIDEVKAGTRPPNGDISIVGGRVQVQGALGVMEINGILAKMIFERNKWNHGFYVEESYVIRWMYPYLTPNGLIMKINPEKIAISKTTKQNDLDFWDWYVRKLTRNPKFYRDIVARKSFSKLRGALAGLYSDHRDMATAENAFKEAYILYPLSPEANFRLVQEVYLRVGKFNEALNLINDFCAMDPGNNRAKSFAANISRITQMSGQIDALEKVVRSEQNPPLDQLLQLTKLYAEAGYKQRFVHTVGVIRKASLTPAQQVLVAKLYNSVDMKKEMKEVLGQVSALNLSKQDSGLYVDMAQLYSALGDINSIRSCLNKYLKLNQDDWRAWLDMATLNYQLKDMNSAKIALDKAVRLGGSDAMNEVRGNPALMQIYNYKSQTANPMFNKF
jgi:tetratricopeptide (TPR) repeat protein